MMRPRACARRIDCMLHATLHVFWLVALASVVGCNPIANIRELERGGKMYKQAPTISKTLFKRRITSCRLSKTENKTRASDRAAGCAG